MKIISWNVNGIRAAIRKGFSDFVKKENPDIMCVQETKAHPEQVDIELPQYENHYWNSADKKGYSGTAIFSKQEAKEVSFGIGLENLDTEGRVITLEFKDFYLVNVYTPNSQRELKRLDYRQEWDEAFKKYVSKLDKEKNVILCGDFNVAHKEIDLKNPDSNHKNAGFTDEEREGFTKLLKEGFIDTFREFNQEPGQYTWWSYRFNARKRNIGWRIDYFIVSKKMMSEVEKSYILKKVMGSDHAPISIMLKTE